MDGFLNSRQSKDLVDDARSFKMRVRAVRQLGLWVAGQLGLQGDQAAAYAQSLVEEDFLLPGDDDVIAKILADMPPGSVSPSQIRHRLIQALEDEIRTQ